ncbi:MAG: PEP-CTERM sorting domain-containing protein [Vicinamibacteria bacterium]
MKRLTLFALAALLTSIHPAEALVISFDPAFATVLPEDSVFVDVVVSDLGAAALGDFDFDVAFDPALVSLSDFTLGSSLGDVGLGEALDFSLGLVAPGLLNVALVSTLTEAELLSFQLPSFSLLTLELAIGGILPGGSTEVTIAQVNAIGDGTGAPLDVDSLGSGVLSRRTVSTTPEPGSLFLLALGLSGLASARASRARRERTLDREKPAPFR